ncbi:MAG: iron-containing alcohol dehydrogenase family protein [Treponema sp.]|nr:iron-containing alcohol dehydrogenase family protein [Treponema sp.]
MITVKTPQTYINEAGSISKSGNYILQIGKNPLIIAGEKAKQAVGNKFFTSLKNYGVAENHVEVFSGYPSQRQFDAYAEKARAQKSDFIIGIGGGRVLDTAKATADILNLPVVTVPTVAATCAAWAAISIQYDDEGGYVQTRLNKNSAKLVIADPEVIFTAPKRYLFSGVVDTFAKFYEIRPTTEFFPDDIPSQIALKASEIAFDNLEHDTFTAISEAEKGTFGKAAKNVIDAIIYLAGFAGSFKGDHGHYSFAHPFYHTSTRLHHTNIKLHGEKVAFGIVTQLILEGKTDNQVLEAIKIFSKFDNAWTLKDFALTSDSDLDFLKKEIPSIFTYVPYKDAETIKASLKKADELAGKFKGGK